MSRSTHVRRFVLDRALESLRKANPPLSVASIFPKDLKSMAVHALHESYEQLDAAVEMDGSEERWGLPAI